MVHYKSRMVVASRLVPSSKSDMAVTKQHTDLLRRTKDELHSVSAC